MTLWSLGHVLEELRRTCRVEDGALSFGLLHPDRRIGVGHGPRGAVVLMLPGCAGVQGYEGKNVTFEPFTSLVDASTGAPFEEIALLRLTLPRSGTDVREAASAVLHGLIDLELSTNEGCRAIAQLRSLFEGGFQTNVDRNVEVGLLGELAVIQASRDPDTMVQWWHSTPRAPYDFSVDGHRLEVKSTSSSTRRHHVTQKQVRGVTGAGITIASVVVYPVEKGETVASLVAILGERLQPANRLRVEQIVMETCKSSSCLVKAVPIDLKATLDSIALFDASEVPSPTASAGVFDMEWTAQFPSVSGGAASGPLVEQLRPPSMVPDAVQ
jgi:hypothetical protein